MKEQGEYVRVHKKGPNPSCSLTAESCAVCTSKLSFSSEPRLLPCLHIICEACFVNSTEGNSSKECSVCGQSFNLSEVTDCFLFEDSAPKCGGCEESAISGWCQECEESLCSDCVSAHQRVKVTRNHTVIPQEPHSGLSTSLRCTSHKQERLRFFCLTCNQLTCRDCQLIDHRNHSFLLIEEAVVTQKEQLMKLLDSIKEHRNRVRDALQDLEGRLNNMKELKALSKRELYNVQRSLYTSLVLRCQQLSKELEGLCNEEEKSLKMMKSSMKMLEDRHEYITAFLQKMLSTEGLCVLRHKTQIDKCAQRVLSQKQLPDTVIHLSLSVNEHISHSIKHFASFKVTRVLPSAKEKCYYGNKPKNTPKDAGKYCSGLNSDSGATLSVSGAIVSQATVPSMSQAASDFPPLRQSKSASSKPVQPTHGLTDRSHAGSSSASCNFDLFQATHNNTTQCEVTQPLRQSVSPPASQSQQILRNQSHSHPLLSTILQSSSSLPSQPVLNIIPTNFSQNSIVMPKVVVPQSQSGGVPAVAAPPGITSCPFVAHPSILVHTGTFQSSNSSNSTNTQSHSLTRNLFVPSLITVAPSDQSILNSLSNHIQQSIFQSQGVSGRSFSSRGASTCKIMPYNSAVSNTQLVNLQSSKSVSTQSNELQLAQLKVPSKSYILNLKKALKFHNYGPALTVNKSTTSTCAPQPAPELTVVPLSINKDLVPPMSSTAQLPAASISSACSNTGLIECSSPTIQIPKCELSVKALADSFCEGDTSVCRRASPVAEESDNNLPTSTVPEENAKAREKSAVYQPQDLLSISFLTDCSSTQSSLFSSKLTHKSRSTLSSTGNPSTKHWLTGLPSSFREILTGEKKVIVKDSCSRSVLNPEQATFFNAKKDDDTNTDNSDAKLWEGINEIEEEPILRQDSKKTLLVSLLRLPISGSTLSQFRIVSTSQKDIILVQEMKGNQSIQKCLTIAAPQSAALRSCSSECSLQADVHDCAVCLSVGALLQCAKCGKSFHTSCHVPPILFNPSAMWVCSLCQDLLDDTDPFRCDRLKEPYLSLPDHRRCEQLLLALMCENNSYLLYKTIKNTADYVEFNLILARLLGKCSPPYRSAAEMVSDLWALFDKLSSNSKKKDLIAKLQSAFQRRLDASFGKSLHASLLRPLSSRDQTGATETELGREKAKNTLKRMRKFLASNCSTLAKKAHIENT